MGVKRTATIVDIIGVGKELLGRVVDEGTLSYAIAYLLKLLFVSS